MKLLSFLKQHPATLTYIATIWLINAAFTWLPSLHWHGAIFSLGDVFVGVVLVVRDFAQREIGHRVWFAMIIAGVLSYLLSDHAVAIASVCAFALSETIDWSIFTYSGMPLQQRILWSSWISAPADTIVFLGLIHQLNLIGFSLMLAGKLFGAFALWWIWRQRQRLSTVAELTPNT